MNDLSCFVPHVLNQVEYLKKRRIGIGPNKVVIKNPQTSCNTYNKNGNCDRFTLSIQYAGMTVECIVIFQLTDPECPPDFLFLDSRFIFPMGEIEIIRQWDPCRSDGLYRALKEITAFYKKKNMEHLEKYPILYHEYLSLYEMGNFNEDDIEIYVPTNPKLPVKFIIQLHVEFCAILPFKSEVNEVASAFLIARFLDRDSDICCYDMCFSEEVKKVFTSYKAMDFHKSIPRSKINHYMRSIEDKLRLQVNSIASEIEKKSILPNKGTDVSQWWKRSIPYFSSFYMYHSFSYVFVLFIILNLAIDNKKIYGIQQQ